MSSLTTPSSSSEEVAKETPHTSEPWAVCEKTETVVLSSSGIVLTHFAADTWDIKSLEDIANAKRAVLAVNAVKPFSNQSLEAQVIEKLIAANFASWQCITDFLELYKKGCSMQILDEAVKSLETDALRLIRIAMNPQGGAK